MDNEISENQGSEGEAAGKVSWIEDERIKSLLFFLLLIAINFYTVRELFSYDFSFAFAAPVIPLIGKLVSWLGLQEADAMRWVLIVFYISGPVSLYFLVKEIAGNGLSAALAAILYSLPIFNSRFQALTLFGDGAHIAALTIIPLVAYWLLRFLKEGSYRLSIITGVFVLLVALISPFGMFVLMAVLMVITFSEMLLGFGRLKFVRFLWVMLVSVGLAAFWYNPEFVRLSLDSVSGQSVVMAIKNLIPISLVAVPILGAIGFLIFDKRPQLQPLFIALGLTSFFGLISFAQGLARFAVSGQRRYLPELLMSISFLWGLVGAFVYELINYLPKAEWFPVPKSKRRLLRQVLMYLFILVCIMIVIFKHFELPSMRTGRRGDEVVSEVVDIGAMRGESSNLATMTGYGISILTVVGIIGIRGWVGKRRREVAEQN